MAYSKALNEAVKKYKKAKQKKVELFYKTDDYAIEIEPAVTQSGLRVATYCKAAVKSYSDVEKLVRPLIEADPDIASAVSEMKPEEKAKYAHDKIGEYIYDAVKEKVEMALREYFKQQEVDRVNHKGR